MLRKVLVSHLRCQAFNEGGRRSYRFNGAATYGRLIAGDASVTNDGDPGKSRPL